ncbi:MAG: hypothetical protein V9G12_25105 [Microthrixaceae bacterium]
MTDAIRNFINGELVEAADGATTDLIDPCTGDVFATAPRSSSAEDIDHAWPRGAGRLRGVAGRPRGNGSSRC